MHRVLIPTWDSKSAAPGAVLATFTVTVSLLCEREIMQGFLEIAHREALGEEQILESVCMGGRDDHPWLCAVCNVRCARAHYLRSGSPIYSVWAMFIIRHSLPSDGFSQMEEARLLLAIAAALELREAGHGEITIMDDTDGFVEPLAWWERLEA